MPSRVDDDEYGRFSTNDPQVQEAFRQMDVWHTALVKDAFAANFTDAPEGLNELGARFTVCVRGEAVIDLMFELNRERGSTLVMVTHDPDIARRCGRQVELSAGRIVSPTVPAAASTALA